MNWKILSTAAAFAAMCMVAPSALANLWRTPNQIIHQASGLCAVKGDFDEEFDRYPLKLAQCDGKNVLQKFYFIRTDTLSDFIPQIVTDSSPMVMIVGAWAASTPEQILNGDFGFSTAEIIATPQLAREARYSWYLDRIDPHTQYSNAYFKIRDANGFDMQWEPNGCSPTPGQSIAIYTRCPAGMKTWRLQPTSYAANP